ncbi:SPOR domain-containing protein [Devosia sp. Root685]|uniref:SPOR domain-containing protein n=1 Tax=Devosia sp. Root685 TaxID=1736587 RepID=UPI0009EB6A3A|nr:SPOR domain-containing protein [Devosia sp. Root685]
MTTAKPKHMAGQTDSADDLIAELARLMAEDAQGDKPKSEPAVSVRIPGGDSPAAAAPQKEVEAPSRPVRIPGDNASAPEPFVFDFDRKPQVAQPKMESPQRVEPAAFAPAFGALRPNVNETPAAEPRSAHQPAPTTPVEPIAIAPQEVTPPAPVFARAEPAAPPAEDMPALDQDSLASLIAAELAVGDEPEVHAQRQDDPIDELDVTDAVRGQTFPREADAFGIPPVFGLGSGAVHKPEARPEPEELVVPELKPAEINIGHSPVVSPQQPKPQALPDPLDEIERLIGPAARTQQAPAPSPALRSLATPTLPPREPQPAAVATPAPNKTRVSSVEEAILAAAETSGARVEWVEPAIEARLPPEEPIKSPRAPRGRALGLTRSLAGPVVATLLLAVAAVGLYTVLGLGSGTPEGPAPLVAADTTPTKEVPAPSPETASQSVVFNEISGANTGADEQIVSRDQSDVEAVTQVASADVSEEGLVNRKVRTVTVRPDGTIVSGGDSLAGSAMLPVDRPSVPEVPGADFSTPDLIANAIANAPAATPAPAQTAPAVVPVQPGSTVPVVDLTGAPVGGKMAPVPLVRPANFAPQAVLTAPVAATPAPSVATAPAQSLPAAAPAVEQPQPVAAAPTGNSAPAYVQLSSQRTEEAARQTAQQIATRFGSLFGGASLEVQRVDLGDRGIFYRVRVPANSLQDANTICSNVKSNGGDCFTL